MIRPQEGAGQPWAAPRGHGRTAARALFLMTFITPGKEVSALSAVGRSYRVSRDSTCPQHPVLVKMQAHNQWLAGIET